MALTLKRNVVKAILALCLLNSSFGFANTIDVTIPPDSEVAYYATNASIELIGPTRSDLNSGDAGLIAISHDAYYCTATHDFYVDDEHYYFSVQDEDGDQVGYFALSYYANAEWVVADGSTEEGFVRVVNGEVVQIDNLEAAAGNPYCVIPDGPVNDYYNRNEDRQVNIIVTGGVIIFNSPDVVQPGEYFIALNNGTRIDTLYGSSLSMIPEGDLSQLLINSININVLDACTIDVNGNTSPKFYVASDEDTGLVGKEQVTVEIDCDSQIGNTVLGSVRLQVGQINDEPNKFYLTNEDYEDNGLYIEGIINQNGSDCDDEGDILFNGETFDIDLEYENGTYGEFTIDWNLCKDEDYIEPGVYSGALDLSVFVK
ncbi:hypothetical protein AB7W11_21030 [Providencia manganoxydans]|uniref:hypothetical protein n=1 Tax=Providencia manganoxydans TaxID=2923283 RepID=UPI0034E5BBAC